MCNTQLLLLGLLLLALMLESHIFAYFLLGQHSVKRPPFHPQISHNFVLSNKINSPPPVLWIRIRMDPELLPGSGSGIIVPDPDPAKYERADK